MKSYLLDNTKVLDLRKESKLSVDDAKLIDRIEPGVRKEYNGLIEQLISRNKLISTGLLLSVTCRNTISSSVLDTLCRVALLEEKLNNNDIPEIVYVDDSATEELVRGVLVKYGQYDNIIVDIAHHFNMPKHIVTNILKTIYLVVNDWFWSRIFRLKNRPTGSITYIDNFLFVDSFKNGQPFYDRYYTGHDEFLTELEKQKEWFAPTLVGLKYPSDYLKLGKGIRKSKSNFLVQEAWLTISDYLYSLIYAFYLPFKVRVYPQFRGYKVECLLSTEIMKDIASPALMKALYRYRFIRRLKKEKVRICGAIDWNENQIIDRAMNMGFKKFFPELVVNGYQGFFVLEQYASLQPTCYEKELGTIPDCIYVVSDYCKSRMLEVCSKLNVKVASAFRFSHLFSMQDHRSEDNPIILVALPNMIDEAKPIVNAAINLASALHSNVTFILKHHPGCTKEILQKHIPEITNSVFKYTDEMMPALLSKASVVISSASSVCIESVAVGIPTAIHGSRYGITLNPIPSYVSDKIWTVFYTSEQLEKFVRSALTLKERNCISEKLFHPIDELGTRSLFKFK